MKPEQLLRLYPQRWRERYADEFLDACGDRTLTFQQTIDIVGGAIDARFAPQSHLAAASGRRTERASMNVVLRHGCLADTKANYTAKDGLVSAAVLLGLTVAMSMLGIVCNRSGWHETGEFLKAFAFPASMLLSSHFTFMKGLSRTAETIVIGIPLLVIAAMCLWASRL